MKIPILHLHVYDTGVDDPIEEADFALTDEYLDSPLDDTSHFQFSGCLRGKHVEIRLFAKDVLDLAKQLEQKSLPDDVQEEEEAFQKQVDELIK